MEIVSPIPKKPSLIRGEQVCWLERVLEVRGPNPVYKAIDRCVLRDTASGLVWWRSSIDWKEGWMLDRGLTTAFPLSSRGMSIELVLT